MVVAFFSQPPEGEPVGRALAVLFDDARALHEHAAGAAGRVQNRAAFRVEHMGDQRHQRDGGEELSGVVGLLVGKLGQKILVDAAEHVARDPFEFIGVERAQQPAEDIVVQVLVFTLGQHAAQAFVVRLNRLHGSQERLGAVLAVGQSDKMVEPGPWVAGRSRYGSEKSSFVRARLLPPRVGSVASIAVLTRR